LAFYESISDLIDDKTNFNHSNSLEIAQLKTKYDPILKYFENVKNMIKKYKKKM
jgi:hypothetical protein